MKKKKFMRRIVAFLLSFVMIMGECPVAFAEGQDNLKITADFQNLTFYGDKAVIELSVPGFDLAYHDNGYYEAAFTTNLVNSTSGEKAEQVYTEILNRYGDSPALEISGLEDGQIYTGSISYKLNYYDNTTYENTLVAEESWDNLTINAVYTKKKLDVEVVSQKLYPKQATWELSMSADKQDGDWLSNASMVARLYLKEEGSVSEKEYYCNYDAIYDEEYTAIKGYKFQAEDIDTSKNYTGYLSYSVSVYDEQYCFYYTGFSGKIEVTLKASDVKIPEIKMEATKKIFALEKEGSFGLGLSIPYSSDEEIASYSFDKKISVAVTDEEGTHEVSEDDINYVFSSDKKVIELVVLGLEKDTEYSLDVDLTVTKNNSPYASASLKELQADTTMKEAKYSVLRAEEGYDTYIYLKDDPSVDEDSYNTEVLVRLGTSEDEDEWENMEYAYFNNGSELYVTVEKELEKGTAYYGVIEVAHKKYFANNSYTVIRASIPIDDLIIPSFTIGDGYNEQDFCFDDADLEFYKNLVVLSGEAGIYEECSQDYFGLILRTYDEDGHQLSGNYFYYDTVFEYQKTEDYAVAAWIPKDTVLVVASIEFDGGEIELTREEKPSYQSNIYYYPNIQDVVTGDQAISVSVRGSKPIYQIKNSIMKYAVSIQYGEDAPIVIDGIEGRVDGDYCYMDTEITDLTKYGKYKLTLYAYGEVDNEYTGETEVVYQSSERTQEFELVKVVSLGTYKELFPDKAFRDLVLDRVNNRFESSLGEVDENSRATDFVLKAIDSIYDTYYFEGEPVKDLTGIEYLINLDGLELRMHDIASIGSIQWGKLTKLDYIDLEGNELTELADFTSNTELTYVNFANNKLSASVVSGAKNCFAPGISFDYFDCRHQRTGKISLVMEDEYYVIPSEDTTGIALIIDVEGLKYRDDNYTCIAVIDGEEYELSLSDDSVYGYLEGIEAGSHSLTVIVTDAAGKELRVEGETFFVKEVPILLSGRNKYFADERELSGYSIEADVLCLGDEPERVTLWDGDKLLDEMNSEDFDIYSANSSDLYHKVSGKYLADMMFNLDCAYIYFENAYFKEVETVRPLTVVVETMKGQTYRFENALEIVSDMIIDSYYQNEKAAKNGDYIYLIIEGKKVDPSKLIYTFREEGNGRTEQENYSSFQLVNERYVVKVKKPKWVAGLESVWVSLAAKEGTGVCWNNGCDKEELSVDLGSEDYIQIRYADYNFLKNQLVIAMNGLQENEDREFIAYLYDSDEAWQNDTWFAKSKLHFDNGVSVSDILSADGENVNMDRFDSGDNCFVWVTDGDISTNGAFWYQKASVTNGYSVIGDDNPGEEPEDEENEPNTYWGENVIFLPGNSFYFDYLTECLWDDSLTVEDTELYLTDGNTVYSLTGETDSCELYYGEYDTKEYVGLYGNYRFKNVPAGDYLLVLKIRGKKYCELNFRIYDEETIFVLYEEPYAEWNPDNTISVGFDTNRHFEADRYKITFTDPTGKKTTFTTYEIDSMSNADTYVELKISGLDRSERYSYYYVTIEDMALEDSKAYIDREKSELFFTDAKGCQVWPERNDLFACSNDRRRIEGFNLEGMEGQVTFRFFDLFNPEPLYCVAAVKENKDRDLYLFPGSIRDNLDPDYSYYIEAYDGDRWVYGDEGYIDTRFAAPAEEEKPEARIKGYQAYLADQFGLMVSVEINPDKVKTNNITLQYTINKVTLEIAYDKKEGNVYTYTIPVATAEVSSSIVMRVLADGREMASGSCTLYDYLQRARYAVEDEETKAAVDAMILYASYAKDYFKGTKLEDVDEQIDDIIPGYNLGDVSDYTAYEIFDAGDGNQIYGLDLYGYSLVCLDRTKMKIYLSSEKTLPKDLEVFDFDVKLSRGEDSLKERANLKRVNDHMMVLELDQIYMSALGYVYTAEIIDSESQTTICNLQFSPVNYMISAQTSKDSKLVNLTKAMHNLNRKTLYL